MSEKQHTCSWWNLDNDSCKFFLDIVYNTLPHHHLTSSYELLVIKHMSHARKMEGENATDEDSVTHHIDALESLLCCSQSCDHTVVSIIELIKSTHAILLPALGGPAGHRFYSGA